MNHKVPFRRSSIVMAYALFAITTVMPQIVHAQSAYDRALNDERRVVRAKKNIQSVPVSPDDLDKYNSFLKSIVWPTDEDISKFKLLNIGDNVNLDDKNIFDIQDDINSQSVGFRNFFNGDGRGSGPGIFECVGKVLVYCKLQLWSSRQYNPAISDMQKAFGMEVKVNIAIVPQRPIVGDQITENQLFGIGRIAKIWIEANDIDGSFFKTAIQYFKTKIGSDPYIKTKNLNINEKINQEYEKKCGARVRAIKQKPVSQISVEDMQVIDACNDEALALSLEGATNAATYYISWIGARKGVNVYVDRFGNWSDVNLQTDIDKSVDDITEYFVEKYGNKGDSEKYKTDF